MLLSDMSNGRKSARRQYRMLAGSCLQDFKRSNVYPHRLHLLMMIRIFWTCRWSWMQYRLMVIFRVTWTNRVSNECPWLTLGWMWVASRPSTILVHLFTTWFQREFPQVGGDHSPVSQSPHVRRKSVLPGACLFILSIRSLSLYLVFSGSNCNSRPTSSSELGWYSWNRGASYKWGITARPRILFRIIMTANWQDTIWASDPHDWRHFQFNSALPHFCLCYTSRPTSGLFYLVHSVSFYVLMNKPGAFTAFRYMLLKFLFTTTVRYISSREVFWTLSWPTT